MCDNKMTQQSREQKQYGSCGRDKITFREK